MATIKHIFTSPKADGTDTQLVRPSDWNSIHVMTMLENVSLSGNTAGALANISSGTFYLAGGNNITLSQNANSVTISGGDTTQFLTTAMASNRGSDFVQATATVAGTNIIGTIASNVISLSVADPGNATDLGTVDRAELDAQPWEFVFAGSNITISDSPFGDAISIFAPDTTQFLTTALASNASTNFVQATATIAGTNISGTIASNVISLSVDDTWDRAELDALPGEFIFAGSNITISESPTADAISIFAPDTTQFLTTAMASDAGSRFINTSAGLNLTSISATFNSNSISLSVGPYLTTAMASNRGSDFVAATAGFFGTNASGTIASNAISVSVQAPTGATLRVSAGTASADLTQVVFSNSNNIDFGLNGSTVTAQYSELVEAGPEHSPGDFIFAGSNVTVTESPTGEAISISVADVAVTVSAGTSSGTVTRVEFSDSNLVRFGLSDSTITADVDIYPRMDLDHQPWEVVFAGSNITISESPTGEAMTIHGGAGTAAAAMSVSAGTSSATLDSIVFSNSNNISFGLNGSTITGSVPATSLLTGVGDITVSTAGSTISLIGPGDYDRMELDAQPWEYVFAGSNITISESPTGDAITIVGPTPGGGGSINFSAGTTSQNLDSIVFSNSNGVSFGINGSTITATVSTNYAGQGFTSTTTAGTEVEATLSTNGLSMAVPLFLTTAMASNRGSDFVQATAAFAGTGAAGTIASGGISVSVSDQTSSMSDLYLDRAELDALPGEYIFAGSNITISESPTADAISIFAPDTTQFLTTAAQSNQVVNSINGSTGIFTFNTGSSLSSSRNANSFTFGLASDITTALQSAGAYLTTAMASNRGSDFVQATAGFNGTNVSGTIASNSISVSVADSYETGDYDDDHLPWEYVFAGSNITISESPTGDAITIVGPTPGAGGSVNFSAGTTSNNLTQLVFNDSNGVGWGLNNGTITATVDAQIRFTDFQGSFLQGGTFSLASDRSGIDLVIYAPAQAESSIMGIMHPDYVPRDAELDANIGEYVFAGSNITISESPTADAISIFAPDTTGFAGIGFTSTTTAGTEIDATLSTNGLSMGVPNWLTTAMASNAGSQWVYTSAGLNLTSISATLASNSISLSVGPYITTARASTDAIGLNTAQTNVTWTVNSSGLSFNAGGYAGTTTAATNATVTLNSAGLAISVGAGGDNSLGDWLEQGFNTPADYIFGSNLTVTENTATDEANPHGAITISAPATSLLTGASGLSVSTNGSTISVFPQPMSMWANLPSMANFGTGASAITQTSGSSIFIQPFTLQWPVSIGFLRLFASFNDNGVGTAGTTSANSTYSGARFTTIGAQLFTQMNGANSQSIGSYYSTSVGISGYTNYGAGVQGSRYTISLSKSYPQTGITTNLYTTSYAVSSGSIVISSNSNTLFTGPLYLDIPFSTLLTPGNYWLGIGASTSSASQSSNISFVGTIPMAISLHAATQTALSMGLLGAATSASAHQPILGLGAWTTNASRYTTDTIGLNSISQVANNPQLPFVFIRQA